MSIDNLSPATAAILVAAMEMLPEDDGDVLLDHVLAAALKALAARINNANDIKQDILSIAAELEANSDDEDQFSLSDSSP